MAGEPIEYRTVDKSAWARGPWDDEPDKRQWTDPATGLPCLAVRHPTLGHWCGYAGVPAGHPAHGVEFYTSPIGEDGAPIELTPVQLAVESLDAHGGVTFSAPCQETTDPAHGVCHVPAPGEPDDVWWFGFDCAHCYDLSPGMAVYSPQYTEIQKTDTYRPLAYVIDQAQTLAAQLAAMKAAVEAS
jgi:hypothetical protein